MANRNLDNSKEIRHLVGEKSHEGSSKIAPGSCKPSESGDCKQVFAILFAL
jgi:hypothetical protein